MKNFFRFFLIIAVTSVTASSVVACKGSILSTPQVKQDNSAANIIAKIEKVEKASPDGIEITIGAVGKIVNNSLKNPATITMLKTALKAQVPTLTTSDMAFISFKSSDPQDSLNPPGVSTQLKVVVTIPEKSKEQNQKENNSQVSATAIQATIKKITADDIIAAIVNRNLLLPYNTIATTNNEQTRTTIKTALIKANPVIAPYEDNLTVSKNITLKDDKFVAVGVDVDYGGINKPVNVEVKLNENPVDAIKNKIQNKVLVISPNANVSTTNKATKAFISKTLQAFNTTLSQEDLAWITVPDGETLSTSSYENVNLVIADPTGTITKQAQVNVQVQISNDNASDIFNKVKNKVLVLPADTPNVVSDPATQAALITNLQLENTALTYADLSTMTFASKASPPAPLPEARPSSPNVVLTIAVLGTDQTIDLTVYIKPNLAEDILNKITNTNVALPFGLNPNTMVLTTNQAIFDTLVSLNPTLTSQDLSYLSLQNLVRLNIGQETSMDITASINHFIASKTIKVFIPNGDAYDISQLIKTKTITLPNSTNLDTSNATTQQAIRTALEKANDGPAKPFTGWAASFLNFAKTKLVVGKATNVSAEVVYQGVQVAVNIVVNIANS